MKIQLMELAEIYEFESSAEDIRSTILHGLRKKEKTLPCKLFYDEQGSKLFDEICRLEEYYPTRTEMEIFSANITEIAAIIGPQAMVVELGSGNCEKTRLLLENLNEPSAYVPVEISKSQLLETSRALRGYFPDLQILPVCADFSKDFAIPTPTRETKQLVVFFPGSTIGNFDETEARKLFQRIARLCQSGGGILIGADQKKDRQILERAYNDRSGITAAFNLNLLKRVAREFGVEDFSHRFYHQAIYNESMGRIEMHLVSAANQTFCLGGEEIAFEKFERITTEFSYKYTLRQFKDLAASSGFYLKNSWTDPKQWFSVYYLCAERRNHEVSAFQNSAVLVNR